MREGSAIRRLIGVVGIIVALTVEACPARAQRDRGLELAQAAYHEAGASVSADEVAAIHAVIVARCNGSARCQMRRFFGRRTSRAYLLDLSRRLVRPASWPRARFDRDAWSRLLDIADRVVRGELTDRCSERPAFWGMRHGIDLERALRAGWTRVDCGTGVRNFFWAPRRAQGAT